MKFFLQYLQNIRREPLTTSVGWVNSSGSSAQSGQLLVLVLVFGSIFIVLVTGLVSSMIGQSQAVAVRLEQQKATEIAEAGLNYYKWFLAHNPGDISGDGLTTVFTDPVAGPIGEYTLNIDSSSYCGEVVSLDVSASANTYAKPNVISTVSARYKQPTVAEYSFITNVSTWYGDSRVINGPVHSNQGIRMDGAHNSIIGSGAATFNCDSSFGCSPPVNDVDGVYTTTAQSDPGLFQFPVAPIDFAGLTFDLSVLRSRAQANGIYYGPSPNWGYLVRFRSNDSVDVYNVRQTRQYRAYNNIEGWHNERNIIRNETFIANHIIDPACPVLFFADKVWLEGDISSKVAIAAADLNSSGETNIVINDNINYVSGTDAGLVAIAETDIDIGLIVPNDLTTNGIFIAQTGRFGRNHYRTTNSNRLPNNLRQYAFRDSLTRLGSVVSNGRVGTAWVGGSGSLISGFRSRGASFDRAQVDDPPPLTPAISDVYELSDWRQAG